MIRKIKNKLSLMVFIACMLALSACETPSAEQVISEGIENPSSSPTTPIPTPLPSATPIASATPGSPIKSSKLAISLGINESVDLRAYDGPVVSQFGGTCSAFATAAAMNNILKKKGINKLVSERHLWDNYGIYDMDEAIDAASSIYLTEQKYWPVNSTNPVNSLYEDHASLKITQYKEHQYNFNTALQGLSKGHPLVMAVQVPSGLGNCDAKVSANSSYTSGQHVVEAVGYKLDDAVSGGGYFIIKNSWGTSCGDQGYHQYPFSLCSRSDLYCYFTEIIDVEDRS